MPNIDIHYPHTKSLKDAKTKVTQVAEEIGKKFDMTYAWKGNSLHFQRSGVSGQIALEKDAVHVTAELGFLLSMLKPAVEREIHKRLEQYFA